MEMLMNKAASIPSESIILPVINDSSAPDVSTTVPATITGHTSLNISHTSDNSLKKSKES